MVAHQIDTTIMAHKKSFTCNFVTTCTLCVAIPPLDSGLLHDRLRKLTPALSNLGGVGVDGAPALVTHFNSLLNLLQ